MQSLRTLFKKNDFLGNVFTLSLLWRTVYGSLRIIFAFTLISWHGDTIAEVFRTIMSHELSHDPNDVLITLFWPLIEHIFSLQITYFLFSYFLFWGTFDIVISTFLLKKKVWAYPVALFCIAMFMSYELFRFTHTHSLILLGVVCIDVFVFFYLLGEYKKVKKKTKA